MNKEMNMPKKKKEYDEIFPDEQPQDIIKSSDVLNAKEDKPVNKTLELRDQIINKVDGAISLLLRNIRNKERAIENLKEAIEVARKLK